MASLDEVKYGSIITIFVIIYTNGCCIKIEDKSNFILIKSVYLFLWVKVIDKGSIKLICNSHGCSVL